MEKTNELNKFLSYIHMGNSVFKIYHKECENLKDEKLLGIIEEIEEIFKTHEEKFTSLITNMGEKPTESLTAAGIMGVLMEKMKFVDSDFDICINAIKSTNMGTISALKFLDENKKLPKKIKNEVVKVINDYFTITMKLKDYIINNICFKRSK